MKYAALLRDPRRPERSYAFQMRLCDVVRGLAQGRIERQLVRQAEESLVPLEHAADEFLVLCG